MGRMAPSPVRGMEALLENDTRVRKAVADLYLGLVEHGDSATAINMLAEHVAILVEMINEIKKAAGVK